MREFEAAIQNPTGLHARPAKVLANLAKQYRSDIRIHFGDKKANAKSLISVLTLGAECGVTIRMVVDGEDEDVASQALIEAILSGLGEGDPAPAPVTARPVAEFASLEPVLAAATVPAGHLPGIPCSPGIAIGPLFYYLPVEVNVRLESRGQAEENAALKSALGAARRQLESLHQSVSAGPAKAEAEILEVHLDLLDDPELIQAVKMGISQGHSAAAAWQSAIEQRADSLSKLDDPLLAARAADLHDVGGRVLRLLAGVEAALIQLPDQPVILAAHDLSPSDTAGLDRNKVLGFCTAAGGATSHSAIIARALGLPAAAGLGDALWEIGSGTPVILDGSRGLLLAAPSEIELADARRTAERWQSAVDLAKRSAADPAITRDGRKIEIAANIGGLTEAGAALAAGAEGVGLLRTEFLFLDRADPPTEDEQYTVLSGILAALCGHPVIVRTMDIGGDKPIPYINMPAEANPFLGVRGVRLALKRPELLSQQLRAIYRAAKNGTARIMFPMVSDIAEWRQLRQAADEARAAVNGPELELGIMIEVPSAALMAHAFAPELDFFSIGTNDLTQYTLAADRGNPNLCSLSDGLHPAVLHLIQHTVESAHARGRWVGVCGELAADPQAVPILTGLGVDELSVNLSAVPVVKAQVRQMTFSAAQDLAKQALACASAGQVRALEMKGSSDQKEL